MATRARHTDTVSGLSRCPFCHDDVRAAEAWVACEQCLARHHEACWAEGTGCATCAAERALERPAPRGPARSRAALWLVVGLGLGWLLGLRFEAITAAVAARLQEPVAQAPAEVADAPPPASGEEAPTWVLERIGFLQEQDRLDEAADLAARMLVRYPRSEQLQALVRALPPPSWQQQQ